MQQKYLQSKYAKNFKQGKHIKNLEQSLLPYPLQKSNIKQ